MSYDPVAVLHAFAEKHGITYPLLSDEGSVVIRRLGLLNSHLAEQHAAYGVGARPEHEGVPYPGSFLLDEQGIVIEKRFEQSYRERETGAALLEQGFGRRSSTHGAEAAGGTDAVRVRAWLDSPTYRFFQRLWLTVELAVAPGLHLYGYPIPEGYIPVSVDIAPLEGVQLGGPTWPLPRPFRVEGLDEAFFVYEGTIRVSVPVTFTTRDAGDQTLRVTVRAQACSATECLPPHSVTLDLPVRAVAHIS